jgi:hypothetical protein
MIGMTLESYHNRKIPIEVYLILIFSPIILPIIIGMMIEENATKNRKKDE